MMERDEASYNVMQNVLDAMRKAKKDTGYVPFAKVHGTGVALPLFGRPDGTQREAERRVRRFMTTIEVDGAWVVSRQNGIVEVLPREMPVLMGREVTTTQTECPLCANENHTTVGGDVPKLLTLADGSDQRLFCVGMHGYVSALELS